MKKLLKIIIGCLLGLPIAQEIIAAKGFEWASIENATIIRKGETIWIGHIPIFRTVTVGDKLTLVCNGKKLLDEAKVARISENKIITLEDGTTINDFN